ncbi:zinc carboxypeptidase A 1-like [Ostrinia furnacalis]|uniref:zinc carboxypeptidase A 1-like n=1 Tax=Ostrinia furnacalis TaxID=93504 RepID=UPI0010389C53|nr:zinc carboxypeptidase A 1-like [Ostrinia furnacalis]
MDNKLNVHRQLSSKGLNHTVLILDVQRRVDEQKIRPVAWDKKTLRRGHRMNWRKYPTVEVINEYMDYLAKNYPSVCKLKEIGKSSENTTIQMLTISNGNPQNQGILLVAGSHAREWIAMTSALIILREIVTKFDEQPKYVQDKDWHVIPLLNPDGFRYTYQRDRFWRKSRGRNVKSNCKGVDLNRNFGTDWHIKGVAEKQPCKELYSGPHPFSEPETRALRVYIDKLFISWISTYVCIPLDQRTLKPSRATEVVEFALPTLQIGCGGKQLQAFILDGTEAATSFDDCKDCSFERVRKVPVRFYY